MKTAVFVDFNMEAASVRKVLAGKSSADNIAVIEARLLVSWRPI